MSKVAKVVEVSASSGKGLEDAIQSGLSKVAKTVTGIRGAWISEIKVRTTPEGKIDDWRVCMRISFIVE
jgi:flavin-binding protein dodecin